MSPRARLAPVLEGVRSHLLRRIWGTASVWAGVAVSVALAAAWLLVGPEGWRPGTPIPLVLDLGLALLLLGCAGAVHRLARRWTGDRLLAREMERASELPPGSVTGSLELARGVPPGTSPALASRAEALVVERLGDAPAPLAGDPGRRVARWGRRGRVALGALAAALVAGTVVAPERSRSAWGGLLTPVALAASPRLPDIAVQPGDLEVPRGSDVEVEVRAPGRREVTLEWQAAGDVARTRATPVVEGLARFRLAGIRAPVVYHAVTPDGARSPDFRITPVDPLLVGDVTVELTYPRYLDLPPREVVGDIPPLRLPAGTRVAVRGTASRELGSARLVPGGGDPASGPGGGSGSSRSRDLQVEGAGFRGEWVPAESGVLEWSFRTPGGEEARSTPAPLRLTVVPDSAPGVRLVSPGRDTVLPLDLRQPLVVEARDDHGVGVLELVAYRVTALGEREPPRIQRLELGSTRGVRIRPVLDVSGWGLLPGDTVRYAARVTDRRPGREPVSTREFVLRMPGAGELRREARDRLDAAARSVEELAREAAEASERTRELRRSTEVRDQPTGSSSRTQAETSTGESRAEFQEREEVRRAGEEQAELGSRVDSLARELEALESAMAEAGAADPGLRRDLDDLRELLEEVATPEARERLQELLREVDEMGREEAREALSRLEEDQESFRERLDASLERFRRAAVEQDFRATTQEATELAREEEALAAALEEDDDPRPRAGQQKELRERAEAMEARMERLERRLQELGEGEAAREVRSAREEGAESRAAMERAARQARQGDAPGAAREAQEAAGGMGETERSLREAQTRMAGRQARAVEEALRSAARDALSLARQQGSVAQALEGADREEMAELRGDVAASLQGMENLAGRLAAGTAGAGGADREVAGRMGRAMEALRESMASLDGPPGGPSPRAAAEAAVDALNQVARSAMARADQGGQTPAGAMEQMQQMMEDLAQQQGQLNNQAGEVMPMQLGQQAMEGRMQQLAEGQQGVADQLGDLSRRPGSQDASLADLQALAGEAGELAEALREGRLEPEVRERQERLFHRLLDAGRSLEKEEESTEREAREPGEVERPAVDALDPEVLDVLRFGLPPAGVLGRLTPGERRLVVEYFERLNRGASAPPGSGR